MASVVTPPSSEFAAATSSLPIPAAPCSPASAAIHATPARQEIRMGRAASVGAGINWLTLTVIAAFHVGALAALFFFSWQRLAVMVALYVVAINVGIGMWFPPGRAPQPRHPAHPGCDESCCVRP